MKLSQLLKIALDLKKYMWQKLKLEKPNIATKQISKPSVATIVGTHFELDITIIKINNQMTVIQVQLGKNIVEHVLINGKANVNTIIENLKTKLGLPKPRLAPYHLRMANQSMTGLVGIVRNLKIHIHGIPYIATFIVLKSSVVDSNYFMLLKKPWFIYAKVTHDWGNNVIIVQGNGMVRMISINKKLGA